MQYANYSKDANATFKNRTGTVRLECRTSGLDRGTEIFLDYDWDEDTWKENTTCTVVGMLCWEPGETTDYIEELFTLDMRQGTGTHLLREYRSRQQPEHTIELQVHKLNTPARKFYHELNMKEVAEGTDEETPIEWAGEVGRYEPSDEGLILRTTARELQIELDRKQREHNTGLASGLKMVHAKSLKEVRKLGLLKDAKWAADYTFQNQEWRDPRDHSSCLESRHEKKIGSKCEYLLVLRNHNVHNTTIPTNTTTPITPQPPQPPQTPQPP